MPSDKCPFSTLQAAGIASCALAQEVVRRGGSEFDCTQPAALQTCSGLARRLVEVGLPALGYADDLTQTPKSAYDRVLLGGLAGVHGLLGGEAGTAWQDNLWGLVGAMHRRLGEAEALPGQPLAEAVVACQPVRRRGRRR